MKKAIRITLIFFLVAVALVLIAAVYLVFSKIVESGTSRFLLVNDSDKPITYSILHDDGDDSRNKTLTRPASIDIHSESEVSEYGGTYCLYILEGERAIQSLALEYGIKQPHSISAGKPVYVVSKLTTPCAFEFNFPFDRP